MTEKRAKRIDDNAVIARMGKMQTFNASVFAVLMSVEHNSAYQWIKRNTGKRIGDDGDLLISWTYDNQVGAMFIPEDLAITGITEARTQNYILNHSKVHTIVGVDPSGKEWPL